MKRLWLLVVPFMLSGCAVTINVYSWEVVILLVALAAEALPASSAAGVGYSHTEEKERSKAVA